MAAYAVLSRHVVGHPQLQAPAPGSGAGRDRVPLGDHQQHPAAAGRRRRGPRDAALCRPVAEGCARHPCLRRVRPLHRSVPCKRYRRNSESQGDHSATSARPACRRRASCRHRHRSCCRKRLDQRTGSLPVPLLRGLRAGLPGRHRARRLQDSRYAAGPGERRPHAQRQAERSVHDDGARRRTTPGACRTRRAAS